MKRTREILKILVQIIFPPFITKFMLKNLFGAHIGKGVKLSWLSLVIGEEIILEDYCEIRNLTIIKVDGRVYIGRYAIVSMLNLIYGCASFSIGKHCYIGPQSLINVDENVNLGEHSAVGARCMIFTHGSFFPYHEGHHVKFSPVTIGNNTWLASGVTINPGVSVGDNVFACSRSVIENDVDSGDVISGNPARKISETNKIKRNMNQKRIKFALENIFEKFNKVSLNNKEQLNLGPNEDYNLIYGNNSYSIKYIDQEIVSFGSNANDKYILFFNNELPYDIKHKNNIFWFDLKEMKTNLSDDNIHLMLRDFMKKYYGMSFEFDD